MILQRVKYSRPVIIKLRGVTIYPLLIKQMLTRSIVCKSGPGTSKVRVEWLDSLFPQTGHSNFLSISRS